VPESDKPFVNRNCDKPSEESSDQQNDKEEKDSGGIQFTRFVSEDAPINNSRDRRTWNSSDYEQNYVAECQAELW
jgi:hypothetical protein